MISVIIVNYHLANMCLDAVHSVLCAAKKHCLEILVVDNSVDRIQEDILREGLNSIDISYQLIINRENTGFAKACNSAYKKAQGEWIALLNPDAIFYPGALDILIDYLQKYEKCAATGPRVYWDKDENFLLPINIQPSLLLERLSKPHSLWMGWLTWIYSLYQRKKHIHYWTTSNPLQVKQLSGGHVVLKKSAIENIQELFDEQFFLYYEDSDLFTRLRKKGYQLTCVPKAIAQHQFDASGKNVLTWKREQMQITQQQYFAKYYSAKILKYFYPKYTPNWYPVMIDVEVDAAFCLLIPFHIGQQWLLEWSFNPYFLPAAGYFGQGRIGDFSNSIWKILASGVYYLRISAINKLFIYPKIWRIKKKITNN